MQTADGLVLDGRNRLRACEAAGVEPAFTTYEGDDPLGYVVSLNLRRRHLSESQRAMAAARIANLRHGQRSDLADTPIGVSSPLTQAEAAELLNVGHRTLQRATIVRDQAIPELAAKVDAGEISVSAASDLARLPEPDQREIVARGEAEILDAARSIRAEKARVRREENEALRAATIFRMLRLLRRLLVPALHPNFARVATVLPQHRRRRSVRILCIAACDEPLGLVCINLERLARPDHVHAISKLRHAVDNLLPSHDPRGDRPAARDGDHDQLF